MLGFNVAPDWFSGARIQGPQLRRPAPGVLVRFGPGFAMYNFPHSPCSRPQIWYVGRRSGKCFFDALNRVVCAVFDLDPVW